MDRHLVAHGANDAVPLRELGQLGHQLADPETRSGGGDRFVGPANLWRRLRLEIPGIELAESAVLENKNARLVVGAGLLACPEQIRQGESQRTQSAHLQ